MIAIREFNCKIENETHRHTNMNETIVQHLNLLVRSIFSTLNKCSTSCAAAFDNT